MASSSIRKWSTRRVAGTSCAISWWVSPARARPGPRRTSSMGRSPRSGRGSTPMPARRAQTGSSSVRFRRRRLGRRRRPGPPSGGDRLTCIYVDHGLMRKKESELLRETFARGPRDAARHGRCPAAVPGPPDRGRGPRAEAPDHRRRVHPRLRGGGDQARPDRLPDPGDPLPGRHRERGRTKAGHNIKPHHNVGGLPAELRFKLIEPLRNLFKDEVRPLGAELGLPDAMVFRHPFPGPGLAIRYLGQVTAERLEILRQADSIVIDECKGGAVSQPVAELRDPHPGPVGRCDGDNRTYANVVAVRAVTSE